MAHKSIIVPLDGSELSERALAVAATIADRAGSDLLLVTAEVQGPLHPRTYLEDKAEGLRRAGRRAEVAVFNEDPATAILRAVETTEDAVVCMATHGRGRLRWAMLGSVAEEVLRRVDRPVLLVGRHCRSNPFLEALRVLACVDGVATAESLAPYVDDWATRLGLDVDVAIVVHPLDVESAEREQAMLDALRAPFAKGAHGTMLTSRFAAGALADHADAASAAMIVMNAHGRGGFGRLALGSVTMGVAQLAGCPVLAVPHQTDELVVTGTS